MAPFTLNYIDHVALTVRDVEASVNWYEKILGLQRVEIPEWKPYPVMMVSGNFGLALFSGQDQQEDTGYTQRPPRRIDHFAFNLDKQAFQDAKTHLDSMDQPYMEEDHHYYHSIYLYDPDGHQVELTTLVKTLPK